MCRQPGLDRRRPGQPAPENVPNPVSARAQRTPAAAGGGGGSVLLGCGPQPAANVLLHVRRLHAGSCVRGGGMRVRGGACRAKHTHTHTGSRNLHTCTHHPLALAARPPHVAPQALVFRWCRTPSGDPAYCAMPSRAGACTGAARCSLSCAASSPWWAATAAWLHSNACAATMLPLLCARDPVVCANRKPPWPSAGCSD